MPEDESIAILAGSALTANSGHSGIPAIRIACANLFDILRPRKWGPVFDS